MYDPIASLYTYYNLYEMVRTKRNANGMRASERTRAPKTKTIYFYILQAIIL